LSLVRCLYPSVSGEAHIIVDNGSASQTIPVQVNESAPVTGFILKDVNIPAQTTPLQVSTAGVSNEPMRLLINQLKLLIDFFNEGGYNPYGNGQTDLHGLDDFIDNMMALEEMCVNNVRKARKCGNEKDPLFINVPAQAPTNISINMGDLNPNAKPFQPDMTLANAMGVKIEEKKVTEPVAVISKWYNIYELIKNVVQNVDLDEDITVALPGEDKENDEIDYKAGIDRKNARQRSNNTVSAAGNTGGSMCEVN